MTVYSAVCRFFLKIPRNLLQDLFNNYCTVISVHCIFYILSYLVNILKIIYVYSISYIIIIMVHYFCLWKFVNIWVIFSKEFVNEIFFKQIFETLSLIRLSTKVKRTYGFMLAWPSTAFNFTYNGWVNS